MSNFPLELIDENNNFLVVNKPKGLVVNDAESVKNQTLQQIVAKYLNIKTPKDYSKLSRDQKEFYEKQGIVHRLDKDTSGVMVVAKNSTFYEKIKAEFLEKNVEKEYTAITFNNLTPFFNSKSFLKVNLPIARNPNNRSQFAVVEGGRQALSEIFLKTNFEDEKCEPTTLYKGFEFSLILIKPKTGRTHQIRVHCKALNAEILGDMVYGGRKQRAFANANDIDLMLHSRTLQFLKHSFTANYPSNFKDTYHNLWNKRVI